MGPVQKNQSTSVVALREVARTVTFYKKNQGKYKLDRQSTKPENQMTGSRSDFDTKRVEVLDQYSKHLLRYYGKAGRTMTYAILLSDYLVGSDYIISRHRIFGIVSGRGLWRVAAVLSVRGQDSRYTAQVHRHQGHAV